MQIRILFFYLFAIFYVKNIILLIDANKLIETSDYAILVIIHHKAIVQCL